MTIGVVLSVSSSVRLYACKTQLALDGFSWNLIFECYSKMCLENSSFIKIWQEKKGTLHEKGYFTWKRGTLHGKGVHMKKEYFTWKKGTLHEKGVLYMKKGTLHEKGVLYMKKGYFPWKGYFTWKKVIYMKKGTLHEKWVLCMKKGYFTWKKGTLHEYLGTFMTVSRWIRLRMRNGISDKIVEKIETRILLVVTSFQ